MVLSSAAMDVVRNLALKILVRAACVSLGDVNMSLGDANIFAG